MLTDLFSKPQFLSERYLLISPQSFGALRWFIHQSITKYSTSLGSDTRGSSFSRFPFPWSHQMAWLGDPEAFPGQCTDIISPPGPRSAPGASSQLDMSGAPPSGGDREASLPDAQTASGWLLWIQKELQLHSESLTDDWSPHPKLTYRQEFTINLHFRMWAPVSCVKVFSSFWPAHHSQPTLTGRSVFKRHVSSSHPKFHEEWKMAS